VPKNKKKEQLRPSKIKQTKRNVSKQRRHRQGGVVGEEKRGESGKNTYENSFQCHWTKKNFKSTLLWRLC